MLSTIFNNFNKWNGSKASLLLMTGNGHVRVGVKTPWNPFCRWLFFFLLLLSWFDSHHSTCWVLLEIKPREARQRCTEAVEWLYGMKDAEVGAGSCEVVRKSKDWAWWMWWSYLVWGKRMQRRGLDGDKPKGEEDGNLSSLFWWGKLSAWSSSCWRLVLICSCEQHQPFHVALLCRWPDKSKLAVTTWPRVLG